MPLQCETTLFHVVVQREHGAGLDGIGASKSVIIMQQNMGIEYPLIERHKMKGFRKLKVFANQGERW